MAYLIYFEIVIFKFTTNSAVATHLPKTPHFYALFLQSTWYHFQPHLASTPHSFQILLRGTATHTPNRSASTLNTLFLHNSAYHAYTYVYYLYASKLTPHNLRDHYPRAAQKSPNIATAHQLPISLLHVPITTPTQLATHTLPPPYRSTSIP